MVHRTPPRDAQPPSSTPPKIDATNNPPCDAQIDRIAKIEVPRFCERDGRPLPVLDLLRRATGKRDPSDVRFEDVRDHEKLKQMLKDKNIELTYERKGGTVLTTPRQRELVFGAAPIDSPCGKFTNTVEYFATKYGIKLKYPHAPTVSSSKNGVPFVLGGWF